MRERVSADYLQIGMFVIELDRPWSSTPFLIQGFIITEVSEIDLLKEHCRFVWIDVSRSTLAVRAIQSAIASSNRSNLTAPKEPERCTRQEMARASRCFEACKMALVAAFDAASKANPINMREVTQVIDDCRESIQSNANAMLFLNQLKVKDDYTVEHSLRVAMMAMALANQLHYSDDEQRELGISALLHDIGKLGIPKHIISKHSTLNEAEHEVMRQHVRFGRDILRAQPDIPETAAEVAFSHHEYVGGGGYPRGVTAKHIHPFARLVAVVDTYDAITSERVYSGARSALEGLGILYDCRHRQFDQEMVQAFIKMMGVYPPGTIVELNDQSIALVLASTPHNRLRPTVMLVRDSKQNLCDERLIDLSSTEYDQTLAITKIHPDGMFGVSVNAYKNEFIAQESITLSA